MKKHQNTTPAMVLALGVAALAGCASNTPTSQPATTAPVSVSAQAASTPTTSTANNNSPTGRSNSAVAVPLGSSVYFDYDSFALKDQRVVSAQAAYQQQAGKGLELQGNADERGSREYNIALGQKRADTVKKALTALGAKGERIETISYGEDKPKAKGHDEAAWAENRRVDFVNK